MYGMINNAMAALVKERFGNETWERIHKKSGVQEQQFNHLESYPDQSTHQLLQAACSELNLTADQLLHTFGRYWVSYAGKNGYKELLALFGRNLRESLLNLNNLHARMGLLMPKLAPPRFEFPEPSPGQDPNELEVHYYSTRHGLTPMLQGIIESLSEQFNEKIEMSIIPRNSPDRPDRFTIKFLPN